MNEELKNCPFCGSDNINVDYDNERAKVRVNGHFVECDDCFGGSGYFKSKEEAIEAWNSRV